MSIGCGPAVAPTKPIPSPTGSATPSEENVPLGRLPADVRPLLYELEIEIDPSQDRFVGRVAIEVELDQPRQNIWLHGNGLTVTDASVTPTGGQAVSARYEQVDKAGVAKLTLDRPVGPSNARIAMKFEGPYDKRLNGLYKVEVGEDQYAFTQMEPVWTRKAFPCFDEPAFKVPFDISVIARASDTVIANTKEVSREDLDGGKIRVRFAKTEPLPTYLIAFAVGPLDVVEAPPIPPNAARSKPLRLRGIAARGRGKELAYALKHTPPILEELEAYFAAAYPYDKLDIIAVPDKGGAMENPGAVTFREWLLLLDDDAPIRQKHAFAYVMAHELAHMWFGDFVTMPWWDDIWLNEAFATWMGYRTVQRWRPDYEANMRALSGVHGAMRLDSMMSARQIRQPVETNENIHAAFDPITYRKGGGVLAMIERWLGPDVFREGLRRYMHQHAHASATADDLMTVLTQTAGRDVGTPFRTFLMQPGLPNIHAELDCTGSPKLKLTQSRYLPLGSTGDAAERWQVPICVRYGSKKKTEETCTLLTEGTADMPLKGTCPAWVMPNAGAAGYYQWSMPAMQLQGLIDNGLKGLEPAEQVSLGQAIIDMLRAGKLEPKDAARALRPLARSEHPDVVRAPMQFIRRMRRFLDGDPRQKNAEVLARKWFRHTYVKLGWKSTKRDDQRRRLLRSSVIGFLLHTGRDPEVRKKGTDLARAYLGVGGSGKLNPAVMSPDISGTVLAAASEDADGAFFDAALTHLKGTTDEQVRQNLIGALTHVRDPALAARARALTLDPVLKLNEAMRPLWGQMSAPATRAATWTWIKANIDPLFERLPPRRAGWLPGVASTFCDTQTAADMKSFFSPLLDKMPGGRREIDKSHESLMLCAAGKAHHLPKIREMFDKTP